MYKIMVIKVTVCPLTSQSPVMNQATIRLGQSMKETEDQLVRDMLATTATVIFATGGINGDSPTEMALSDIQSVTMTLLSNNAKTILESVEGANKFGTAPVNNAYIAMAHTDLSTTLSNLNGFINTIQYPNQSKIKSTEWGSVDRERFFLSSRGSISANASGNDAKVYNTFICGMEAYCNVKLDNYKSKFVYNDSLDPLKLNQYVGWKMSEVPVITNDAWIVNLKSTL